MTGDQERWQEAEREERWALAGRRGREPRAEVPHGPAPEVQTGLDSPSSFATAPNPAPPIRSWGRDGEREEAESQAPGISQSRAEAGGGGPSSDCQRRSAEPRRLAPTPPQLFCSLPRALRGRDGGPERGRAREPAMMLGCAVPACPPPAPVRPRARRAYLSAGTRGPWAAGGQMRGGPGWLRRRVAAEREENL